jgi:hypothetical protein
MKKAVSFDQSVDQLVDQSVDQSIDQSVDQSVNQSVDQSVDQSVNQSVHQSVIQFVWSASRSVSFRWNLFELVVVPLAEDLYVVWAPVPYSDLSSMRQNWTDFLLVKTVFEILRCTYVKYSTP